ncbi:MAG: helix-turn-helix domain-containing protein [Acidobacteriota bacterium]|nr:helix-turn-helix domain-containing protein [Acidobacteriota bacterium]
MLDLPRTAGPGDVLAQATRARLFALLDELRRPAGTAELAERLGLHPNGVRVHLERLEQAGMVERSRTRGARGRPADRWAVAPGAQPGGEPPRAYRDLGRWLARAMRSGRVGERGVEAIGREVGRELAPAGAAAGGTALASALAALGFQPSVQERREGRMTLCLGNCPYRDAVRENQPTVCALHKGITRGLLDVIEPRARLAAFTPRDPDEAGCLIELKGMGDPGAEAG